VSVKFENIDQKESETKTSDAQSGTIPFDSGGQRFGDSYEITVRLIDDTGEVQSERVVIEDTADGN